MPKRAFAILLGAAFLALIGSEIHGFRTANLFGQEIWTQIGLRRFVKYTEIYAAIALAFSVILPRFFGAFFVLLLAVLTAVSVGPAPLLAIVLLALSANALGTLLMGHFKIETAEDSICATLLGAGVYSIAMTFLARLPVNYPAVWAAILATPILLDARPLARRCSRWLRALIPSERPPIADRAALALLVFVLTAHWIVAMKPETGADALAMHLSIPANIATRHQFTIEPSRWVWAVMPMGTDFLFTIGYLLGGEYATRLLIFVPLLGICALLFRALRRWTTPTAAYLLTTAFAAAPIVQLVTGSLFVENFLAAMVFGVVTAVWRLGETGERRYYYLAMALGGITMSLKFGALAFVLTALPFAIVEARRAGMRVAPVAAGFALALALAAPPYAIAYVKTGNPLFPFLNNRFHSKFLPTDTDLRDERYHEKPSLETPYKMTFHSDLYYEGQRGSLGFHLLLFAPLGLLGLAVARGRPLWSAAAVAFVAGGIVLSVEPNARYVYAAMPLCLIPVGAMLAWTRENQRVLYGAMMAALVAAVALDIWFLPSASYYHKDFSLRLQLSRTERARYVVDATPLRAVIARFNRTHAGEPVMLISEGSNAELDGDVYESHWHQFKNLLEIRQAPDLPALVKLMQKWNIQYFISRKPMPGETPDPPLWTDFLLTCTLPEYEVGLGYLARLDPTCSAPKRTEPAIVLGAGFYDAWDPGLAFAGEWKKQAEQPGAGYGTVARSDDPGAAISVAFEGKSVRYFYERNTTGGIATVTVDGAAQEPIDFYYKERDAQHQSIFCCFGPGRHVMVVRAAGKKNEESGGYGVNVDYVVVVP